MLYFEKFSSDERQAASLVSNACMICGVDTTYSDTFAKHDNAVHEVYALRHWGMQSVRLEARPYVESWSNGTHRLPTREEWDEKFAWGGVAKSAAEKRTRVHYFTDNECGGVTGNDSLATTTEEVNCSDCIHKMYEQGVLV